MPRVSDRSPVKLGLARHRRAEGIVESGELDRARLVSCAQPDGKVQSQRPADLLAQELTNTATVDAAHEFANEVSVEQRRLSMRGPRLPGRRLAARRLHIASQSKNSSVAAGASNATTPAW